MAVSDYQNRGVWHISKLKLGIRFKNVRILDKLSVLKSDVSHLVLLLLRLPYIYRNGFVLSACLISMPSLKWDMSQPSKMFIA